MSSPSPSHNGQSDSNSPTPASGLLYDEALPGSEPDADRGSQLREWVQILWGGKWIILGVIIITMVAAAAYTHSIPTRYRTSSLLMVDRNGESSALSGLGRSRSSSFLQQDQSLQNELLILRQSRTIANRVADRLLQMDTHPETGTPLQVLRDDEGNRISSVQVAGRVKNTVNARPSGENTKGLYISAQTRHPREASLIVNVYAEEYIQRTREKSRADLKASRTFLQEQADTLRTEVQAAERRLQEYMSREQAVSLDQETGRIVNRISDLESKKAELQIELDMKQASIESLKEELDQVQSKLADRVSSTLRERLTRLQKEKAELESQIQAVKRRNAELSPGSREYRELQRLQARTAQIEQKTDSLANQYVEESLSAGGVGGESGGEAGVSYLADQRRTLTQKQIERNGLQARLDVIRERLRENRQSLQEIPSKSIRMAQLQRERRSTEKVYNFIQEKLQEARLAEQSQLGYAEVIRPAGPGRPIRPDMKKNLFLALFLGAGLGGGLVILGEQLDTRIHQPADLREYGHNVLGVVPSMTPLIEDEFGGDDLVEIDGRPVRTTLAMLVSPMSAAAEAYRRIRTNLRFTRPDTPLTSIVISSAEKGAGKTTTCLNLALSMASAGKDVIVIDADLRRPWVHELLDLSREPGLSQALYESERTDAPFSTAIDNLSVIPAGEPVPNPAELLGSNRMQSLLSRLESEYDYVFVDTPPALLFSDMLGLTPHCDGSILVARSGETDGNAFDHTTERVREVEGDLIGVVLNQVSASSIAYYKGADYGYAYTYAHLEDYYEDDAPVSQTGIRNWWNT